MLRLVSDNPDPLPHPYAELVFIDARHEAEWAQLEPTYPRPSLSKFDQTTADGWSVTYAIGFACFGAGALATAAVAWVISWFL